MSRTSPRFVARVNTAKEHVQRTDVHDVKRRMDAGEPVTLVDIREDREWKASRIPGAVHLGKGIIERDIEDHFPDTDSELVLYCGGGSRSAIAAESLEAMGYTRVISMDGGIRGWRNEGFPVDESPAE